MQEYYVNNSEMFGREIKVGDYVIDAGYDTELFLLRVTAIDSFGDPAYEQIYPKSGQNTRDIFSFIVDKEYAEKLLAGVGE